MQEVHWVTPLGWPVSQPYQKEVTVLEELPKEERKLNDATSEEEWLERFIEMKKRRYNRLYYQYVYFKILLCQYKMRRIPHVAG